MVDVKRKPTKMKYNCALLQQSMSAIRLSIFDQRPNGSGRPWPRKKAATPAISASALSSAAARCFAQWASHSVHSSGVNSSLTQPFQNHTAHQPVSFSQQYLKTSASSKPFSVGT